MMTMCLTCMDVPRVRGLYGELRVNRGSDYIRIGELGFMIIGITVDRQGPPSAFCLSSERVGVKSAAKGPFKVRLLLCHVRGRAAISAFVLPLLPSSSLQDVYANCKFGVFPGVFLLKKLVVSPRFPSV